MTLKQEIQQLLGELPDDSPLLAVIHEVLRVDRALGEAFEDIRAGRIYSAEELKGKLEGRWPRRDPMKT